MRARHRSLDLFARYVGPEWRRVAILGFLVAASIALQLAAPQLLRSFIDNAIGGADVDVLVRIAILFVAIALGQQLAAALATYLGESIGWVATNAMRADLALHCLTLDLGFHKARTPGELIERIDGDVTALAGFFSRFIVNVLGNVVLLIGVLIVVAFAVGGWLWTIGAISVGTVYLLFYYTELLRRPIEAFRRELEDMQRAIASLGRVDELMRTSSAVVDGLAALPTGALGVELDGVSFGYDAGLVLRDVSVRIEPGRVLGILGRTGSGKTTLARLLVRFYDPTSGAVRLGGVDLRDAALDSVRSHATLVSQDVQLFSASVRDNLTLFDRRIDDAQLTDVLARVGLGSWLRAQPGTDPLGAEMTSGGLSAGEAQLLAFARVFLRDPGLVVLDEASSRLDPVTERHVERAIDALLANRTAIVIAHRLATVDRCDEILILEDGRVAEYGSRAALASDPGSRFAQLLRIGLEPVLAP